LELAAALERAERIYAEDLSGDGDWNERVWNARQHVMSLMPPCPFCKVSPKWRGGPGEMSVTCRSAIDSCAISAIWMPVRQWARLAEIGSTVPAVEAPRETRERGRDLAIRCVAALEGGLERLDMALTHIAKQKAGLSMVEEQLGRIVALEKALMDREPRGGLE